MTETTAEYPDRPDLAIPWLRTVLRNPAITGTKARLVIALIASITRRSNVVRMRARWIARMAECDPDYVYSIVGALIDMGYFELVGRGNRHSGGRWTYRIKMPEGEQ